MRSSIDASPYVMRLASKAADILQRSVALAGFTATVIGTIWLCYGVVQRRNLRKLSEKQEQK
eukprot:m.308401 g.308401  ORF g.308401 m.308401 type:complete len:62 (+) comp43943_c0_seq1:1-186(+)